MVKRWALEAIPAELWEWHADSGTFQVAPVFWAMPTTRGGRWAAVMFATAKAVFGLGS